MICTELKHSLQQLAAQDFSSGYMTIPDQSFCTSWPSSCWRSNSHWYPCCQWGSSGAGRLMDISIYLPDSRNMAMAVPFKGDKIGKVSIFVGDFPLPRLPEGKIPSCIELFNSPVIVVIHPRNCNICPLIN